MRTPNIQKWLMMSSCLAAATVGYAWGPAVQTPATAPEMYQIKLTRPENAAYDAHFTIDQTLSFTTTDTAQPGVVNPPRNQNLQGDLQGRVKVMPKDAGAPFALIFTVKSFKITAPSVQEVPAGTVLLITPGDQKSETSAGLATGEKLSPEVLAFIAACFERDTGTRKLEEELFSSDKPRRLGESWPVDKDQFLKILAITGTPAKAEDITVSETLKSAEKTAAGPAVRVAINLAAENLVPPKTAAGQQT